MLPFSKIQGGTLIATASTAQDIVVSSLNPPDYFIMKNITQFGSNVAQDIEFWWEQSMAQATARGIHQAVTTSALNAFALASDGISFYNTSSPPVFAALPITAVNHTTWVVSMASTSGIGVGDIVRLYNVVNMQEISGYLFQVTAVTTNTSITLGFMATAQAAGVTGITVDGTTGFVQKIIPNRMYPRYKNIVGITQAAAGSAIIYFSQPNDFTPGETLGINIPTQFGMVQLNAPVGSPESRVLVSTNTATNSSVIIDTNTSGFTAFSFPTSAIAAAGVSPATARPSASSIVPLAGSPLNGLNTPQSPPGTNLQDAFDNRNHFIIHLGSTIFANSTTGDVWMWQAYKYDKYNDN